MRPILLLTKNLLAEQSLQGQLQHLNYEVFCSVKAIKQLKISPSRQQITQGFQAIIFSETLSDEEVRNLRVFLGDDPIILIRKFGHVPSAVEKETVLKMGMDTWIYADQEIDSLREHLLKQLTREQKKETNSLVFLYQKEDFPQTLSDFKLGLTNKECDAFECLMASEGRVISREILCQYLWGSSPNNSRLTQISVLMKRLKEKLQRAGFQEDLIQTVWGHGYKLSPKLLQFYAQEIAE